MNLRKMERHQTKLIIAAVAVPEMEVVAFQKRPHLPHLTNPVEEAQMITQGVKGGLYEANRSPNLSLPLL